MGSVRTSCFNIKNSIKLYEEASKSNTARLNTYPSFNPDVGKTSLIQVLLHDNFQEKLSNTLGACYHRYEPHGEPTPIDIWDTAGQEKFRSLLTLYYKNSDAVIIVFDLSDPSTFATVDYWARQIDTNCDVPPCTSKDKQV